MRTKYTAFFSLFLTFCFLSTGYAQQAWFRFDSTSVVSVNGKQILNPWAGGLNAPQFLKMDLNNDNIEDLIVFERTSGKIATFVAADRGGSSNSTEKVYKHAPSYEVLFPPIENWVILKDYNRDGYKDLFTSTALGIMVYRQVRSGNTWSWKLQRESLNTKGFSGDINLQVSGTDIPGIQDIDEDGDLDILTFDFSGTYIELHQNMSMERYGVPDSLGQPKNPVFIRNGDCWGNFHKGDGEDFVFGNDCGVVVNPGGRVLHAGNSILFHDMNGDGKKDLLAGHVSNVHISFIANSAPGLVANFTSFTNTFPTLNPVSFNIFPAAFMEDVDFDGVEDLIVAPSVSGNDGNLVDFKSSNWLYHNAGTSDNPNLQLVQKNFLQDQMLDAGENASPSFFDVDGDGDLDMIIGTGGVQGSNGFRGGFWLLRNAGTAKAPVFELASDNYLNLNGTLGIYNIKPQWADFNGDGVPDLGFFSVSTMGVKPEYRYIPNKGTLGGPVQLNVAEAVLLAMPPETQINESPFFYDADNDGDLDLLIGKSQGNISYYVNSGTNKIFTFKLDTESFAGVVANFEGRFSQPVVADIDLDGQPDLLTVDQTGTTRIFYGAPWGKWTKRENLLIYQNGVGSAPVLGRYLSAAVADYNSDGKPDLVVGNNTGGLRLLYNVLPISITGLEPQPDISFKVYPNPSADFLRILSSDKGILTVFSQSGKTLLRDLLITPNEERELAIEAWPTGMYILELKTDKRTAIRKVLVR